METKLNLSKQLADLRFLATDKKFETDPEVFKKIEDVKVKLKNLDKKS